MVGAMGHWKSRCGKRREKGGVGEEDSTAASSPGLYSNSDGVPVPKSLIFFTAYHTAASHHIVRGHCSETRACN
ncbi:hypothetical protein GW17_00056673 [Ensete ventricosum]|nr:hypothetical protein GW17_00056673 [Ensete ventricosum]